jgi:chromate reductase, NAD(P)H dehydrogenase (quinone)
MAHIIGIAGSLRKNSYNGALLRAARELVPDSSTLQIEPIDEIPLYNFDLEKERFPAPVARLKDAIAESDGLLLVTPEYNNSLPGVLKNVIDWLTRPPADIPRVFTDLPVAIMGASPGRNGTVLAQAAWLPVLRTLRTRPWFAGRLQVGDAAAVFDEHGELVDEKVKLLLEAFVRGFSTFADQHSRRAVPRTP